MADVASGADDGPVTDLRTALDHRIGTDGDPGANPGVGGHHRAGMDSRLELRRLLGETRHDHAEGIVHVLADDQRPGGSIRVSEVLVDQHDPGLGGLELMLKLLVADKTQLALRSLPDPGDGINGTGGIAFDLTLDQSGDLGGGHGNLLHERQSLWF